MEPVTWDATPGTKGVIKATAKLDGSAMVTLKAGAGGAGNDFTTGFKGQADITGLSGEVEREYEIGGMTKDKFRDLVASSAFDMLKAAATAAAEEFASNILPSISPVINKCFEATKKACSFAKQTADVLWDAPETYIGGVLAFGPFREKLKSLDFGH